MHCLGDHTCTMRSRWKNKSLLLANMASTWFISQEGFYEQCLFILPSLLSISLDPSGQPGCLWCFILHNIFRFGLEAFFFSYRVHELNICWIQQHLTLWLNKLCRRETKASYESIWLAGDSGLPRLPLESCSHLHFSPLKTHHFMQSEMVCLSGVMNDGAELWKRGDGLKLEECDEVGRWLLG